MDRYFERSELMDLRRARIETFFQFLSNAWKCSLDDHATRRSAQFLDDEWTVARGSFRIAETDYVLEYSGVIGGRRNPPFSFVVRNASSALAIYNSSMSDACRLPLALVTPVYETLPAVANEFCKLVPELETEIRRVMALS